MTAHHVLVQQKVTNKEDLSFLEIIYANAHKIRIKIIILIVNVMMGFKKN